MAKIRKITSLENLEPKILELFNKKYPAGYAGFVQNIPSPKGEMMHVVPLETDDCYYLVKVKINIKKSRDDDDDDFGGEEIPEAGEGLDDDKNEFGGNDDEEDNYGDGPAEEYDDDDDNEN